MQPDNSNNSGNSPTLRPTKSISYRAKPLSLLKTQGCKHIRTVYEITCNQPALHSSCTQELDHNPLACLLRIHYWCHVASLDPVAITVFGRVPCSVHILVSLSNIRSDDIPATESGVKPLSIAEQRNCLHTVGRVLR
jgi:hypothetical protein